MTTLGKLLVLLNTVFSFLLMSWSLSALNNRIDWSDRKAQGDQPAGELARRRGRIDELWAAVRPAEIAWRNPRAAIVNLEKQRPGDRAWYAVELEHLRTGATADKPARAVVYERGVPALDAANFNRPRMENAKDRNNQSLRAMNFYENELTTAYANLAKEVDRHQKLVEEDTKLTIKLVGDKAGTAKGLRQRLIDERTKQQELGEEEKLVKPMLINAFVESQLILKRAESLKARIEELQRAAGPTVAVDK